MNDIEKLLTAPEPTDLITTTKGNIMASKLKRVVDEFEDENELTHAVEY